MHDLHNFYENNSESTLKVGLKLRKKADLVHNLLKLIVQISQFLLVNE